MNPVTISMTIPGMATNASSNIGGWVSSFYVFALLIGGILAFGAIVYGGIRYTFAAGDPGGQSEGKEWIKSALIGLLLLASAYIILYVVNPNLVSLATPNVPTINSSQQQ